MNLSRRLLPLYAAAFFQGFVLWYAIEKLFMRSIGFDDYTIGVMVAVYSAISLLAETPSGILADRWSRKGVLILGSVALAITAIVGGLSTGPQVYIIAAICWGLFYALYSGTYEAIIYDTLTEETGSANNYERYYGRFILIDSIALVIGSLIGGVVGQALDLRASYYLSIPLAVLSIICLAAFKEPKIHKAEVPTPLMQHIGETFKAVFHRRSLLRIIVILILTTLVMGAVFEFAQLWWIALMTPVVLYGPANALILSAPGIASLLQSRIGKHRRLILPFGLVAMLAATLILTIRAPLLLVVLSQATLGIGLISLDIVYMKKLQDELPSKVRAGAGSAVSTVSGLIYVGLALVLGYVSDRYTIFIAAWLLVLLMAALTVIFLNPLRKTTLKP